MTEDPTKTVSSVWSLRFCFHFFLSVFLFPLCPWIPSFILLEYLLLLLEQGERSLKGHTRLFLVLANLSSYPDDALYAFYDASLNSAYRAPLAKEGPRVDTFSSGQCNPGASAQPTISPLHGVHAEPTADGEPRPPRPTSHQQTRCESRQPHPPRGRVVQTVRAQRGAPPLLRC